MKELGSVYVGDSNAPVGSRDGLGFLCLDPRRFVRCLARPDTDRIADLGGQSGGQQDEKRQYEAGCSQGDPILYV